jgi:hypothetical protein
MVSYGKPTLYVYDSQVISRKLVKGRPWSLACFPLGLTKSFICIYLASHKHLSALPWGARFHSSLYLVRGEPQEVLGYPGSAALRFALWAFTSGSRPWFLSVRETYADGRSLRSSRPQSGELSVLV